MKLTTSILIASCLMSSAVIAEPKSAQVAMLGTFHFSNPGQDAVKNKQMNVMSKDSQSYLEQLTNNISSQMKPNYVLVECSLGYQQKLDDKFNSYINNNTQLAVNEIYQLGFRIAKKSNAELVCFDERDVGWESEPLMQWLEQEQGDEKLAFDNFIKQITSEFDDLHKTLTLQDMLKYMNQPETDALNKSFYMRTNHIGAGAKFEGADSAASWWHRNFRMYANIQQVAQQNSRVLVIAGQGHTAILRDLLKADPNRETMNILDYL